MTDLKGSKCRCGFAINAEGVKCPRCGKKMKSAEWANKGTVLSCTRVGHPPEGENWPVNIAMVQVTDKGPKIICWTDACLSAGDEVIISEPVARRYLCEKIS